jgi:hypothetical protein
MILSSTHPDYGVISCWAQMDMHGRVGIVHLSAINYPKGVIISKTKRGHWTTEW